MRKPPEEKRPLGLRVKAKTRAGVKVAAAIQGVPMETWLETLIEKELRSLGLGIENEERKRRQPARSN